MFEDRPERSGEIVFVGRSNVGKSTLMREITGHRFEIGSKPGVTRKPNFYDWSSEDFVLTDLPGFGFMSGVPTEVRERIKTDVIQYLELYSNQILVSVLVVDGKSGVDIIDRHIDRGEIPHDVELFEFLVDLDIPTVVAVNKMDKVDDRDQRLDEFTARFGLYPPWQQWKEVIAPISAKRGQITPLREAIKIHLHEQKRDDLLKIFS